VSATIAAPTSTGSDSRIRQGMLAGLAAGAVFGLLMAGVGMLPMVGMMVGIDNAFVGFLVHMMISAFAGALFAVLTAKFADNIVPMYGLGMIYGVVWWLVGALIIMPLWLSVTADPMMSDMVFVVGNMQWVSLFGHVLFGWVLSATTLLIRGHGK
jgi:uncharacterized membrane protein YagU involved in acid resistance